MKKLATALALAGALVLPAAALAEALPARETAHPLGKNHGEVGIFNELQWGLTDELSIEAHPILFLAGDFHATLRLRHAEVAGWTLSGEYGLAVPTLGMRLTQNLGFASPFFPTWEDSDNKVGLFVVPHVGLLASSGKPTGAVITARADLTVGVPLGQNDALPVDSVFAPLELVMAPMLTGFRLRIGGGYDHPLMDWLRLRGQVNLFVTGKHPEGYAQLSTFFLELYAGVDLRVTTNTRFTLGVKMFNWDQHATKVKVGADGYATREHVRSTDFWPTIDFIWRW
ncbi:MAG: hypothetical protein P1V51_07715 [Deltaproteobacteria bacterium]|nr:hypothetical protein [Deltaproteobacteria bacterium]